QDSVDLGWKLEACLRGWGGPELLRSYQVERRPVAIRNVQEASGNLRRMLGPRLQKPPREAFKPGPEGDRARREFGDAYTKEMAREWFANGIHLGYRYEGSPIVVPDGTPEPPDTVSTYTQTARPGHRAPHAWLADGRSTLDLFGRGFVLLRFGSRPAPADGIRQAAADKGVPLEVVDIDDLEIGKLYENQLVLVRPDGHVAWRADVEPSSAEAIIEVVRGAGATSGLSAATPAVQVAAT
ncbi:MAG TPA: FAD-dependent monooxygenase, partial [Beijerinckiaceae bacterium]|nr:FAD-dependent monooxygenase [Beijerinckiaceae bacterium]